MRWVALLAIAGLAAMTGCAEKDDTLTAPDTDPPVVSSVSEDDGRVSWQTDEDAECVLLYGSRTGTYNHYGYSVYDGGRAHHVDLIDIEPDTYYFRVMATDRVGNSMTTEEEFTFDISEVPLTDNLIYTMVDVGWGDCHFVECPNGTNIIVDSGYGAIGEYPHSADVDQFLMARGVAAPAGIDYMVCTHAHADHYGYFLGLVPRFPQTHFLAPGQSYSSVWDQVDDVLTSPSTLTDSLAEGQTDETVDFLNWDEEHDIRVKVLSSGAGRFIPDGQAGDPINNDSAVLKITYGQVDIILGGDAEEFVEQRMVKAYGGEMDIEVFKVGHHANNDASSPEYLDAISARVGFIPNSLEENPGVFDQEIIDRLLAYGVDYYVSDRAYMNGARSDEAVHGHLSVITDGETYTVWSWQ
jgi:beta-lactamase superfamily II metal-dependent hydrolase